jgi:hypothetical protein
LSVCTATSAAESSSRGLAAHAVTFAELGVDEANVHGTLIRELHRLGVTALPAVLRDATAAMSAHPQTVRERAGPIRETQPPPAPGSRPARRPTLRLQQLTSPPAPGDINVEKCGKRVIGKKAAVIGVI